MNPPALLTVLLASFVLVGCEPFPGTGPGTGEAPSNGGGEPDAAPVAARQPINAEKLCARLVSECAQPTTMLDCLRSFTAVRVTRGCADALDAASCQELASPTSAVLAACFPPCSGELATCNGDGSITVCTTAGTTTVLDCDAACRADGARAYSGTCGTSYGIESSDRPQCWCK